MFRRSKLSPIRFNSKLFGEFAWLGRLKGSLTPNNLPRGMYRVRSGVECGSKSTILIGSIANGLNLRLNAQGREEFIVFKHLTVRELSALLCGTCDNYLAVIRRTFGILFVTHIVMIFEFN